MIRIAIDPGVKGAVAVMMRNDVTAVRCPETPVEMADVILRLRSAADRIGIETRCVIEKVGAGAWGGKPGAKMGSKSAFTFGENYGLWRGLLAGARIPFMEVPPKNWQRCLATSLPADYADRKRALKAYSQQRFPDLTVTLDTADALAMMTVFDDVWR